MTAEPAPAAAVGVTHERESRRAAGLYRSHHAPRDEGSHAEGEGVPKSALEPRTSIASHITRSVMTYDEDPLKRVTTNKKTPRRRAA